MSNWAMGPSWQGQVQSLLDTVRGMGGEPGETELGLVMGRKD